MPIIVGTLGKSAAIDQLVAASRLDVTDLRGKWESFVIATVPAPLPGVKQALVIAGSDKRGTIYGIYELSEQLGVSPWYWWADVPVKKRTQAYVLPGRFGSGEPVVRYRGIFLNDEAPCLTGWTDEKFGGMNSNFYTKVFELLLRLRANYLWPAMWDNAFNEDDSENPRLADEYGIVMGTSHHEPMMRAHKEWTRRKSQYGNGEWNYATNAAALKKFFREGIARNKPYENLVTIGMRGDGDVGMATTGSMQSDIAQPPELPTFDSFNPRRSYIEVFAEGTRPIDFMIEADQPWIKVQEDSSARVDRRFWVEIDWKHAPVGSNSGFIAVKGKRKVVNVKVTAVKASEAQAREARGSFASLTGPIAFNSYETATNMAAGGAQWQRIAGYGRGQAAMSVFPVTTPSVLPPQPAPRLEYEVYVPRAGEYEVTLVLGPVMDFVPDRGMRIAAAFDDRAPQVLDVFEDRQAQTFLGEYWQRQFTRDNVRYLRSTHEVSAAGPHRFKITMVDPGIVVERIVISDRDLPTTYFGPPAMSAVAR